MPTKCLTAQGSGVINSIPPSIAAQLLLRDPHRRQHRTSQLNALGTGLLGREQLGEPALEIVQLGAVVLAEAEEPASIGADDGQQPLLGGPFKPPPWACRSPTCGMPASPRRSPQQVEKGIPRLQIQHLENPYAEALRLHATQATLHRHVRAVPVPNCELLSCALSAQLKNYRLPSVSRVHIRSESTPGLDPGTHPDTVRA